MKWVLVEKARVDRIACPSLISRFIDKAPTFLFAPANQVKDVAAREDVVRFDMPGVEPGHHSERCSFDALLEKVPAHRSGTGRARTHCAGRRNGRAAPHAGVSRTQRPRDRLPGDGEGDHDNMPSSSRRTTPCTRTARP